jgi:Serine dehydratase beta chain
LGKEATNVANKIIDLHLQDQDPLGSSLENLIRQQISPGMDRRAFLMRSALIGAMSVITGRRAIAQVPASAEPKGVSGGPGDVTLSPNLAVVKDQKGPVMTLLDEFYKVGPGPSSSHTIGPMRITYDFYQRCTKLPPDQLAQATALKVHLYGSLSATGKGHGTERASLAGLIGKEPATVDPLFLDGLRDKPDQTFPVALGSSSVDVSLKDVVFDSPKGDFPHPNTMRVTLMAGDKVLLEQEYYSVGGGFIEWKGDSSGLPRLDSLWQGRRLPSVCHRSRCRGGVGLRHAAIYGDKEANPPQFGGTATGVINFLNFTFSALLGPVFGWLLQHISGTAGEMERGHYQTAFAPLLVGVVLAIVLSFLLKETGPAARALSTSAV